MMKEERRKADVVKNEMAVHIAKLLRRNRAAFDSTTSQDLRTKLTFHIHSISRLPCNTASAGRPTAMETLDGTEWDVVIVGTGLPQSLLALYGCAPPSQARHQLTDLSPR